MGNYENIAPITMIDGELTKKWQRVVITGEVFRAKVHPKALKAEDTSYSISIKLDKESFMQLKKMKLDSTDKEGNVITAGNRPLTGLKKVDLKVKGDDGEFVLDEMDEPVKEFAHFQISVYQNKQIKGQDVVLPVVMATDNSPVDSFLNEGTKVSILGQAYETVFRGGPAMGLNLKEVKVHELVSYEGGSGSGRAATDPWASLGMTAAVVEKAEQAAPQTSSQAAPAEVPELPESPQEVDFDSDIPF